MCGIAGALSNEGPVEPEVLERMCQTLRHRGPDSRGLFADDGVALGVQRLAVIDLEGGDQPITSEDGSVVVVCNGEVYNYRELREELIRGGHRFATRSDAEVIVHLYQELGENCVDRLRGMFAFALWDRSARQLVLARDRVGKKPLFYARRGEHLWFASEPRAILSTGDVARDVDHGALDLFLHYQCVPAPRSAFAAIRKLPPAHVLTWHAGTVRMRRYWKLSYENRYAHLGEADACELIRDTLLEATRLRLRSDVPVGALLSGGVDSSSVVAAMAQSTPEPVKAFSIGFEVADFDETASARAVARRWGAEHHHLVLGPDAMDVLPRLVWHYGEPFADSSALATMALAELASRHVTVALNGDGGDESFAGYRRYLRFASANGAEPHQEYATRRATGYFDAAARRELYAPEFRAGLGERRWLDVIAAPYLASDADGVVERLLDVDVQTYLHDDLLVKMDIATMAHSLEARSPLLDPAIMELAAGLPIEMKLDGATTKRVFKQAVRGWLPEGLADRPKMGFRVPLGDWLRGPLRDLPADVLLDPRALGRGLFREERVRDIVAEHRDGTRDHTQRIWTLIQLELWFQTYVDRARVDAPLAL
ncbi:MAG: asparagine synthase (glutamine-hydrolyzing) [Actinomycetota bacterium]|nr:asparagine synthase (glutamine-hydrolyzing) [Actinomycetota bacterium]